MASAFSSSSALMVSKPPLIHPHSSSPALLCPWNNPSRVPLLRRSVSSQRTASAVKSEFDIAFFERDLAGSDAPPTPTIPGAGFPDVDDKEEPQCPPGLRRYETMVVLRPDMSEDERLAFTQKYEELLVAGGGMYVEVFNRGVIPLAYSIRKKNKAGESNTYLDGIYLLFTYFTKPESMTILNETLLADDDVIRSSSFKIRKRKF
ncbi:UNVERIFIED_CONTAM: 30S ribosomal protein S6 alpha, chloroplastic [Sesamum calycinum]|uniref:30S ribosomal protein S6 alpha, chloroplastic n=1 Tax=Sesamum calycinum TaxID=2727403 RepID=A0AAW2Q4H4_9LAMI